MHGCFVSKALSGSKSFRNSKRIKFVVKKANKPSHRKKKKR
jgi:hypothetical protein